MLDYVEQSCACRARESLSRHLVARESGFQRTPPPPNRSISLGDILLESIAQGHQKDGNGLDAAAPSIYDQR